MMTRFFTGFGLIDNTLASFGICGMLAGIRAQLLQQRVSAPVVESTIDLPLIYLTIKTSPSVMPGIFMCFASLTSALLAEHKNHAAINKIKNACALGLYFVCCEDEAFIYQAAKFIFTSGAAWLSYEAIDQVSDRLGLPRL